MDKTKRTEPKECCSARNVLWYLTFTGFAINYMMRLNLNIAIVSMVQPKPKNNISLTSECIIESDSLNNGTILSSILRNEAVVNSSEIINVTSVKSPGNFSNSEYRRFDWNEKEQGYILGSYFWFHWLTQIPGGLLATKYGTKKVFGLANLMGILGCLIIPWFAYRGSKFLIFIRCIQGMLCGFAWPSMHNLTANWIPPNERSRFVSAYLGSSVGAALTYPLCGFIIDRWGWEMVFYVCAMLGATWFIAWWCLVYDSPKDHPRISEAEKEYILSSLAVSNAKKHISIPWKCILTDITVWMNSLAQIGGCWGIFTLITNGPTYFKFVHGWSVQATGILSGLPHVFRMLWSYIFSMFGDYLLRSNMMSRTNVRKFATFICCGIQGLFMLGLAYSGCNRNAAIIFLTLAVASNGAVSTGPLASMVDTTPNYAIIVTPISYAVKVVTE
nr:sialin [Leptinotarsa decemlineata]